MSWELAEYNLAAVVLLATFWLLIARRVGAGVNGYAFQSIVLGLVCMAAFLQSGLWHLLALALTTVAIKGVLIPVVLRRQVRSTVYAKRETSYHVGFPTALLAGAALSVAGFVAGNRLPLVKDVLGQPVLGVAIAVVLIGFFMTMARREAVMQLTGLLVADNGLLLLGLVLGAGLPLLIDFALFGDVLVGAVVMGFLIARMHETVASTDTSELTRLRG
jgi:hydrogenase-4 component E